MTYVAVQGRRSSTADGAGSDTPTVSESDRRRHGRAVTLPRLVPAARLPPRHVLFVTTEIADFIKAGGLGDVSAALPRALTPNYDVRVLMPGYRQLLNAGRPIVTIARLPARHELPACEIGRLVCDDGLVVYVVLCAELYDRVGNAYGDELGVGWADNDIRFARLALAAAEIVNDPALLEWRVDLMHLNDWATGLAAGYVRWLGRRYVPSVYTIHNLAYQGVFPVERMPALGIPSSAFHIDGVEFHGQLSFMKAGLSYAAHVTTVSNNYAEEITTPAFGCGLEGLLKKRALEGRLSGLLNGIDDRWDPRTDPHLAPKFGINDWHGKRANTQRVRRMFGLAPSSGPLFAVVSRLVQQKGLDLTIEIAETIVRRGGQLVVIGRGEFVIEQALVAMAARFVGQVGVNIGFDEGEARQIYAGSDFLLMPSRFEPCGLSQLYAQRFGSLPVAHRTGGLADTIQDGINGLLFDEMSLESYRATVLRAFDLFRATDLFYAMRRAAMAGRLHWRQAVIPYRRLYSELLAEATVRSDEAVGRS
ncbi:glycogen synthase GlgA [Salinicola rhizosphaerae]|uniref:Glycogen synthase n=1 Tax=Salinicola rhizosphaerae TaxID=1443141 RepID=A0ABQ3DW99_9GAMM|nr:glycogen synthase GlgA [Salinicola rhizosphaerae]GHB15941.1 glycogen synthase [Salinicola rhizosphaerae]